VAFGNELDYTGDLVSSLDDVDYYVYTTGENVKLASAGTNLPGIAFEVLVPNSAPSRYTYASLVWVPDMTGVTANTWSGYIDATATGKWGLTSSYELGTCGLKATLCTFDAARAVLGNDAFITSVAVTKGRDKAFQRAVDGLRINADTYDFEPFGVFKVGTS